MKTLNLTMLALILVAGAVALPLSFSSANADTSCKFNAANQRCDFDINRVNGPFKLSIINEQNNSGGGGGGNASTVDQVARDQITANDQKDVIQSGNITSLAGLVKELKDEVTDLKADIQTLNNSAITGISLSNGSASGPVTPPVEPPVDNGTNTGNGTGPIEPPVEPPIDNGTGNNGTGNGGNGTEFGNFTG